MVKKRTDLNGEMLRKGRKELKLTTTQLGSILGVTATTVTYYEVGKIEPSDEIKKEYMRLCNIKSRDDFFLKIENAPLKGDAK